MKIKDAMLKGKRSSETKHFLSHFTAAADKCTKLAKSCTAMGEHFSKMAECAKAAGVKDDLASIAQACSQEFSKMADAHLEHGEHCAAMAEECQKADAAGDLAKSDMGDGGRFDGIVPTGVSGVAPDTNSSGNRLVRRDGGNGHKFVVPEVASGLPAEFAKLCSTDEVNP